MAQDTSSSLSFYLLIKKVHIEHLSAIRQWSNLKIAFELDEIWISNFNKDQIKSIEVKSMPYKTLFYSKKNKLYFMDSLLPERNEPTLLWTPIERALPLKIETYNHNYFGIEETNDIRLIKNEEIKSAKVMLTTFETLKDYAETAPEFRLSKLEWVILNDKDVLIFGNPTLPIQGQMYWVNQDSILPVGYDFELAILTELIGSKFNSEKDSWIIWNIDSSYFKVEKNLIKQLSLSSIRKSFTRINAINSLSDNAK